jgi:hypothetical protein
MCLKAVLERSAHQVLEFGCARTLKEQVGVAAKIIGRSKPNRIDPILNYRVPGGRKAGDTVSERSYEIAECLCGRARLIQPYCSASSAS